MAVVHLQFISDFICPWCYLGKVRLDKIKQSLSDEITLDIAIKPYILYPHIPKGGLPKSAFTKHTKPGMGKSLRYEAEQEGIQFNYKYIEQIPNSLEAHRLIWLITNNELKYKVSKRIFHDYFEVGQDIEAKDYLIETSRQLGVAAAILEKFYKTAEGEEEVKAFIKNCKEEQFISVVPTIQFNHKITLPGLQPANVWENYIRRAAKKL